MARILFGVHGSAHGHAVRALTIARHYPEHDFLFVSHADGAGLIRREFPVFECPNPVTPVRYHKVATGPVISRNAKFLLQKKHFLQSVLEVIDRFKPDLAISDYEFLVPRACRKVGLPCLSVDHQHITNFTSHTIPPWQRYSYIMNYFASRFLFTEASDYMVISFFRPPMKKKCPRVVVVPPLLRDAVLKNSPHEGEHVVAYQSTSTFKHFFPFLRTIDRNVIVYGFDSDHLSGNLKFKRKSEGEFLEDLAGCKYVVCGGGHTMISEALYYGKPVMSFPIKNAFEQQLNAHYIDQLGYGKSFRDLKPKPGTASAFESSLDQFKANLQKGNFFGNPEIFSLLDRFIREKRLPSRSAAPNPS